ncbi:MAG: tol-pal system-associated acyl-CoA thioesterase [Pseudomonadota bacterium]
MDAARVHRWPIRVYYDDTDAAGLVYHAQYLAFCERARTEFLRALGLDHRRLRSEHGVVLAVRHAAADFRRAGFLDDALEVLTRVDKVGGARLQATQHIVRKDELLCTVITMVVVVGLDMRPRRLPRPLETILREWVQPTAESVKAP